MHVTNRSLVDAKLPIADQLLHFLSLDDYQKGRLPVSLAVHHKLIGFADIELQVIVVALCNISLL